MMIRKGKTDVRGKIRKSNSDSRYEKMKQVSYIVCVYRLMVCMSVVCMCI